ncbi:hypothetical protein Ancab_025088, partial [Ancistrocladus abbreviatus]
MVEPERVNEGSERVNAERCSCILGTKLLSLMKLLSFYSCSSAALPSGDEASVVQQLQLMKAE